MNNLETNLITHYITKIGSILSSNDKCPYGLDIPFACKCAGDSVSRMAPLSVSKDDAADIAQSNKRLLVLQGTGERCKYANNIFDEKKSVECGYDSDSPGVHPAKLEPAPFYSKVYHYRDFDAEYWNTARGAWELVDLQVQSSTDKSKIISFNGVHIGSSKEDLIAVIGSKNVSSMKANKVVINDVSGCLEISFELRNNKIVKMEMCHYPD